MTRAVPPLANLDISGLTAKYFDQSTIDRLVHLAYVERTELFFRMASREDDFPNKELIEDSGDDFVMEIRAYLMEAIKASPDRDKSENWDRVYWEIRRRARLMYGLPI